MFDAVNSIGASPFTSGDAFYDTPQYTAVSRDPYTTQVPRHQVFDPKADSGGGAYVWQPPRTDFDQQGYDTARMDNMMNYLTGLGGFFRGMGSNPQQVAEQQIINNAPFQGATSPLPMVGGNVAGGGTVGNNPFGQVGVTGGGWGTPGAGYGLLGGGE